MSDPIGSAEVIAVVRTTLECRGAGTEDDPHRRVTQYWTIDGELLAEVDEWRDTQDAFRRMAQVAGATIRP